MPWYSYFFFVMAALALFVGASAQARLRNTGGVILALVISGVWATLGFWTGGFFS